MIKAPDIMRRILISYRIMLGYFGVLLVDENSGRLERSNVYVERYETIRSKKNNRMRITRMLKFLGEVDLERLKLPFLVFFAREICMSELLADCRVFLERSWIPTLRRDEDLASCQRFLRDPSGPEPASVLTPSVPPRVEVVYLSSDLSRYRK
mmetsp:Transcript_70226/g.187121  ORF Transcript_70226/g.187121 Transcript_70226/m.187121 type:complete len:153 (-) Transcript_70226:1266-1724(-)